MDVRTKTLFSISGLAVALGAAGCGYNQQSRFQAAFLPPAAAPSAEAVTGIADPPSTQSDLYVAELPSILRIGPKLPDRSSRADLLVQRAEKKFQNGKRYYQANDVANARREFDAAVDLMLDASDLNLSDRQAYERRMDEMVDTIHRFDLAGMGAAAAPQQDKFEKAPLEDILQMTFPVDPKLKDKVREQVAATVSQLPLSVNDTVLGYINYFSNRGRNTLVAAMERSGRYRPMIQRILEEEGIPPELIHLAQAESGFIPRAVSRKAAGGMWQFLTWRGQQYGLLQTAYTDDRMDPEKATHAAAHHLHDLYTEFGDWYLAIAAYNCGPGVVEKAVERTGYADFWELRRLGVLPAETTNYVPIILAMTIMEKNAAEYGLEGITLDPPLEYDTVQTSARTGLTLVADILDAPVSELAQLNPSVLKGTVPADYPLHVPKGTGNSLTAALQLVPPEHRDSWRMHRVAPGETLASIAQHYGIRQSTIADANSLSSAEPREGDRLVIPAVLHAAPAARHTVSRRSGSRRTATVRRKPAAKTASAKTTPTQRPRRAAILTASGSSR